MSDTAAAPEAKKGKGKIIIIAVVALALVAGGWFFFLKPDGKEKAPEPGAVLVIEPITVNLSGGNYLKIGVTLQLSAEAGGHGEPNPAPALDLIVSEYSQASLADVTGKREEMKEHLEEKIIKAYHHDVLEIWLTEYVAQ
jgi:flagellar FliL protein